jgi:hypothetical protein
MAAPMIDYQKIMAEIVYINLPAPEEPVLGMMGMDLLHGFLGEFERATNKEVKAFTNAACLKWNVHYRTP